MSALVLAGRQCGVDQAARPAPTCCSRSSRSSSAAGRPLAARPAAARPAGGPAGRSGSDPGRSASPRGTARAPARPTAPAAAPGAARCTTSTCCGRCPNPRTRCWSGSARSAGCGGVRDRLAHLGQRHAAARARRSIASTAAPGSSSEDAADQRVEARPVQRAIARAPSPISAGSCCEGRLEQRRQVERVAPGVLLLAALRAAQPVHQARQDQPAPRPSRAGPGARTPC